MPDCLRILGIDPGLQRTGWGVIEAEGVRLRRVAHGVVTSTAKAPLAARLHELQRGLDAVLTDWQPHQAAVEETFMNNNAASALKLGQARGVCLLVPAMAGLPVHEYAANLIKKSVVGAGHADKGQVIAMIGYLLPGAGDMPADAADALAVAICHAHHAQTRHAQTRAATLPGRIRTGR